MGSDAPRHHRTRQQREHHGNRKATPRTLRFGLRIGSLIGYQYCGAVTQPVAHTIADRAELAALRLRDIERGIR